MKSSLKICFLLTILLQAILMFCPGCFLEECWTYVGYEYRRTNCYPISFFGVNDAVSIVFTFITLGCLFLAFVSFVLNELQIVNFFSWNFFVFPIINLVALSGTALYIDVFARDYSQIQIHYFQDWNINGLFYVILTLNILTLIFAILIKFGAVTNANSDLDATETIKQYEALLNCGAIAQEEYEAQKNKLLGSNQ